MRRPYVTLSGRQTGRQADLLVGVKEEAEVRIEMRKTITDECVVPVACDELDMYGI